MDSPHGRFAGKDTGSDLDPEAIGEPKIRCSEACHPSHSGTRDLPSSSPPKISARRSSHDRAGITAGGRVPYSAALRRGRVLRAKARGAEGVSAHAGNARSRIHHSCVDTNRFLNQGGQLSGRFAARNVATIWRRKSSPRKAKPATNGRAAYWSDDVKVPSRKRSFPKIRPTVKRNYRFR